MISDRFSRRRRTAAPEAAAAPELQAFTCNICGTECAVPRPALHREEPSCTGCNSNVRFRSLIAALSQHVHSRFLTLDEFPIRTDLIGLGMSDWEGYAVRLRRLFGYDNTYYDEQIRLDVMAKVPHALAGSCDFIISSDVLEHVAPPFELALSHIRQMLKPGGLLLLSVPMRGEGVTDEHYPELGEYEIVQLGGRRVLVNRTPSGELQVFDDLVFHGGPGVTLEMRMVSVPDLIESLKGAGFVNIRAFDGPVPEHGVEWIEDHTWPILAEAPR